MKEIDDIMNVHGNIEDAGRLLRAIKELAGLYKSEDVFLAWR